MTVEISSSRGRLCLHDIQDMLSKVYWSPGITGAEVWKGIGNSALVVGAYAEDGRQVGFLRVISDRVRFAYVLDVVVREDRRRQGIARQMVNYALAHPELAEVYHWLLMTSDAHGVYEKCGFEALRTPEKWMAVLKTRPDRADYPA